MNKFLAKFHSVFLWLAPLPAAMGLFLFLVGSVVALDSPHKGQEAYVRGFWETGTNVLCVSAFLVAVGGYGMGLDKKRKTG